MFLIPEKSWEVKNVKGKGKGIFVKQDIPAGTIIGDYTGRVIHPKDEDMVESGDHFYLMYYHDYASIYPDLSKPGIHLLNHSCTPNTWMYTYRGHTLYFAIRKIFKGEELTVSYLLDPQDKECKPCTHICHCGAIICFQTMHLSGKRYEEWVTVHDAQEKKTKPEKVKYGEELKPLDSYPTSLPDHPVYTLFGCETKLPVKIISKKIPTKTEIRRIIRETGRTIQFSNLNLRVHGVFEDLLVSQSTS